MTLTTPYQASFYVGDGETKAFPFVFEELSDNFVKVIVLHIDGTTSIPTYIVDLDLKQVVFGDETPAPTADDVVCIYRETPTIQDTPFKTLEGYNAKALENILSKIVAMIQEIKSNYFSTQVLQGDPWQLDLLSSADDGATVNIDFTAKKLIKGLYFKITDGNLQVSADDSNYITMPKSSDIVEFRQNQTIKEDLTVEYRLQYRVGNTWYNAESNAEATADEALQIAQDAKDIAQETNEKVDTFDARLTIAEGDASDAKQNASDAKELAEDTAETVSGFDSRITQAEQNASDAKSIAQTTSGNLTTHTSNTNNPHQVTKAQVGLGNVDNTSDLNKPVSTATQNFVNSSIATSTATFRGTYNSLAELEAVTADENDYGFVVATDSAGNTVYNRYKYTTSTTPASWVFEYALNNSSFTAQQWATINSGATANDVALARSAVQPSDVGNGTITITQGGTTIGTFTTNQGGNTMIDLDAGGGAGHNVGDIFFTMRPDNELNGAVECDGATYQTTDFAGAQSIGQLLEAGKIPYVSLADYEFLLQNDGSVGQFGWDGTGTTAFRVPKLNTKIFVQSRTNAGDFCGIYQPGVPNIKSNVTTNAIFNNVRNQGGTNGAVTMTQTGTINLASGGGQQGLYSMYIDASQSSSIYKNNVNTVQPYAVRYRLMVQLAIGTTDEALETCTGVLADVADLKTNKSSYCSFNTNTRIAITNINQTAAKNGWLVGSLWFSGTNTYLSVNVNDIEISHGSWSDGSVWSTCNVQIPIKQGQTFRYGGNGTMEQNHMYFYPDD
jgi:hypothetical protein